MNQDTAHDHYPTRTIDELTGITELVNRLLSYPLAAPEISMLRGIVVKVNASVRAKRLAEPTPLLPRQLRNRDNT